MIRRPPRSPLCPYATLFRSFRGIDQDMRGAQVTHAKDVLALLSGLPLGLFSTEQKSEDRKSTRLNSSHANISYAVSCLKNNMHVHGLQVVRFALRGSFGGST